MAPGKNVPIILEVVLGGEDVRPETLPVDELTDLLSWFVRGLKALTPDLGAQRMMSLVALTTGSTGLAFSAERPELWEPAIGTLSRAIQERSLSRLPIYTRNCLLEFQKFAQRHTSGAVILRTPSSSTEARIDANTQFSIGKTPVRGESILYGFLTRIGGVKPTAWLRIANGELFACKLTQQLAKELAPRLYEYVGLSGVATWDADNQWELVEFEAQAVTPYQATPPREAFKELASVSVGSEWLEAEDVATMLDSLREGA